ncbi:hypothetical protein RvY_04472 [Ramazzottius varieornatus]|uniref:Uncharacterized protein n=1 Tax=Ramazzottius varieornatus TaxID=947166 RepID=A0A1D1UYI7_RAMVA|nr:hypothetical protein RvY_04472 [Ramazzottius varieornatus]
MAFTYKFSTFLVRAVSVILVITQGGILDWYLGYYGGTTVVGWIVADALVVALFIASYLLADTYFEHLQQFVVQAVIQHSPIDHFEDAVLRLDHDYPRPPSGILQAHDARQRAGDYPNGVTKPFKTELNDDAVSSAKSTVTQRIKNDYTIEEPELSGLDECDICRVRRRAQKHAALLQIGHFRRKYNLGALPLSYVSWAFYSIILTSKMLVIFLTFGDELNERLLFGTNMLELAFVATAGVFGLVLVSHRKVPKKRANQRLVINYMQNQALMDIIDSVEMLYFLFDHSPDQKLNVYVRNAILALVSIQLIIPTLGLYQLSTTNFADQQMKMFWSMLQQFINVFGENVPFLVIRIYMWTKNQHTGNTFVFVAKNIVEICTNQWDFVGWGKSKMVDRRCKAATGSIIPGSVLTV